MKNNDSASEFPNIYRRITESKHVKRVSRMTFILPGQSKPVNLLLSILAILTFLIMGVLIIGIGIFSFKSFEYLNQAHQISLERQRMQEEISFWQSIANKYEGYKDAYFQMAILDYQLGNFQKAKTENKKALTLDPNFEDAKKLELLLENK